MVEGILVRTTRWATWQEGRSCLEYVSKMGGVGKARLSMESGSRRVVLHVDLLPTGDDMPRLPAEYTWEHQGAMVVLPIAFTATA